MIRRVKKTIKDMHRLISLILFLVVLLLLSLFFAFRPIYGVTYKGKFIGYSTNVFDLQDSISKELLKGDKNATFYDLEEPIEYKLQFMKKGLKLNDDIISDLKKEAVAVYKYFLIKEGNDTKYYYSKYEDAQTVINSLKDKKSTNYKNFKIDVAYFKEQKEEKEIKLAIEELYIPLKRRPQFSEKIAVSSTFSSFRKISYSKIPIGITLASPISGPITSHFQPNRRIFGRVSPHTGIDIGRPTGTKAFAAQDGTVVFSAYNGAYGNMVEISHGNGVNTIYAHLSKISVSKGSEVKKGEVIGLVGSTGRSTGSHLHFEIRIHGTAVNPIFYVSF